MHELSIAMHIVDIALQTAQTAHAKKINKITIEVGALSGVDPESLKFCFSEACKNTAAEEAELDMIIVPAQAQCPYCGATFMTAHFLNACPKCGQEVLAFGAQDLKVKRINVD